MKFMKYFDLHCDTPTRMLDESQGLYHNSLHVSLEKSERFGSYAQIMAVWTNHNLSDADGYKRFFAVAENLHREINSNSDKVTLIKTSEELENTLSSNKVALILSVEDARILQNDLARLKVLHSFGVRTLTLNWYGETCIGGAHDTTGGLTDFGKNVVKKCFELGITPDISHSSFKGAMDTIELAFKANKPIIASHSDSYSVNPHSRNLRDEDLASIIRLKGLVGINLCPLHLSDSNADMHDVLLHIEHYLSLGAQDILAMGCDLDGTALPQGFTSVTDISKIADEMAKINYTDELIEKIMYKNAYNFFKINL